MSNFRCLSQISACEPEVYSICFEASLLADNVIRVLLYMSLSAA